jgi:hypothetical protein
MAKHDYYLPRQEKERVIWMDNFARKFAVVAASLGFTPAEVTSVNNDLAMLQYLTGMVDMISTMKQSCVAYKKAIAEGSLGKVGGAIPTLPTLPAAPALVPPGIFARTRKLVQRIKYAPSYTSAIGKDLGIVGALQTKNTDSLKPVIKLVKHGTFVEVQWTKGAADAIRIEVDRNGEGWKFVAIDAVPHYKDYTPVAQPAVWKYRAIYLINDEIVGQWSDESSITVS